jgi:hypothetical protein
MKRRLRKYPFDDGENVEECSKLPVTTMLLLFGGEGSSKKMKYKIGKMLHEKMEKLSSFLLVINFSFVTALLSLASAFLLVERMASDVKIGKYPAAKCSTHAFIYFISFCLSNSLFAQHGIGELSI